LSIATAYLATHFNNIMDFLQLVFGFVNAPLFATFLLGMFWKRTTSDGAFWGLISGTVSAFLTYGLTVAEGQGGWFGKLYEFPSAMAQSFWVAIMGWSICLVITFLISVVTKPKPEAELRSLVYGFTDIPKESATPWYQRPGPLAIIVIAVLVVMNILFW
jgi:SSS family solute:Na+ symporter